MADDRHLHNAAATLQAILTRRQPEYAWVVEVLPREQPDGTVAARAEGDQLASKHTAGTNADLA